MQGAFYAFKDKYDFLPGDMINPNIRLRDCTTAPCATSGNGDGVIEATVEAGVVPVATQERVTAFPHMAAADLISGVEINGTLLFGSALPEADMGGGFWIGYNVDSTLSTFRTRPGHHLVYNRRVNSSVDSDNIDGVEAVRAAQIDRKIDDGSPVTGDMGSVGNLCIDSNQYNEDEEASSCGFYIRIGQ